MFKITVFQKNKGWSKLKLSHVSGVTASAMCSLEKGKVYPYSGWKKKLTSALGVDDPDSLFQEVKKDE